MNINLKVLAAIACFMVIAASAVVTLVYWEQNKFAFLVEVIRPKAAVSTERDPSALQLQINAKGLTISVPGCDITKYRDRFFLHLYTTGKAPSEYVSLDFDLAQEKNKESITNGRKKCTYFKSFGDFTATGASIGQFTMPDGKCCEPIWSRNYVFDEKLLGGR